MYSYKTLHGEILRKLMMTLKKLVEGFSNLRNSKKIIYTSDAVFTRSHCPAVSEY